MSVEMNRIGGEADLKKKIPSEINHHTPKDKKLDTCGWQTTSRNNIPHTQRA